MDKVTVPSFVQMKREGRKIVAVTAYDYTFGRLLDRAGVDIILVGDSLGMVMQGQNSTLSVTVDDIVYHTRCVTRGVERALVIADLPFASYERGPAHALGSAARVMAEGGAHMVKMEGGAFLADTVRFLVERGVPVCAHIGLMPQHVHRLGGYRVQGGSPAAAQRLKDDARALEDAGASLVVLEVIPSALASAITVATVDMATIGIGAGPSCDGQVLVLHDLLGISDRFRPRFTKDFMAGAGSILAGVEAYASAVRDGRFPGPEHGF